MIFSVTEQDKGNLFNHIKTIFKENHFQYYTEDSLQWGRRVRISLSDLNFDKFCNKVLKAKSIRFIKI
jgi:hypothetical protein